MKSSDIYTMPPSDIKFDDKYVVFNALHNEEEYAATKESIHRLGQLDPILVYNGECIDGRHRTRAARELGLSVRCIDILDPITDVELIMLCNKNVTSGRDYDSAQKAIQALRFTTEYKVKAKEAAVMFKVDKRLVSYAATLRGYGREDILEKLMKDKKNRILLDSMERPSRSLELLAKYVKAESEETNIVVDDSERVQWEPNAHIKTEKGKAWYYEQVKVAEVYGDIHYKKLLVELANLKYKLQVNTNE